MRFINYALASAQEEFHPETAEEAVEASEGVLASLGIDVSLFIFQLINFAIILAILWFLILKPLTKKMSERQGIIDKSIKNAKQVEENLKNSEEKYEDKLNQARKEAVKLIEESKANAEKAKQEILNEAEKESAETVEKAKKEIQAEKEESLKQIKTEAANITALAVEKVLNKEMNDEERKRLVKESSEEIDKVYK